MNSYSQSKDLYNIEREESCNYTCLMCNVYYLSAMLRTSFVLQWCTLHCSCVPGFGESEQTRYVLMCVNMWVVLKCTSHIDHSNGMCVRFEGQVTYVSVPRCAPLLIHETAARRCAEINWGGHRSCPRDGRKSIYQQTRPWARQWTWLTHLL